MTAISIFDKYEDEQKNIKLEVSKTNSLIGLDFKPEQIKKLLERLHFKVTEEKPRVYEVKPPYFRLDIGIEEDLIEEVARIYGYDKIPSKVLPGQVPEKIDQKLFDLIDNLKKQLVHQGLSEIHTYSFYSTNVLNALGWNDSNKKLLIKLENPMSKETEYMRLNVWPNLVESAVNNNKYFDDIAIFEIGKSFSIKEGRPFEKNVLSAVLVNETNNPMPELLKIISIIFENLGIPILFNDSTLVADVKRLFHPHKLKSVNFKGRPIGGVAELHPQITDNFGSKNRIAICEIDLEKLL